MKGLQCAARVGLLFAIPVLLFAQNLPVVSIGTAQGNERCYALLQSGADNQDPGCYLLAGYTDKDGESDHDVLIVKTDATGLPLWSRTNVTTGPHGADEATSVCRPMTIGNTSDYVVCGWTQVTQDPPTTDIFVARLDVAGNPVWAWTYSTPAGPSLRGTDKAYSVIATTDGGFLVTGWTDYFGPLHSILLLKLDPLGAPVWWGFFDFGTGGGLDDEGYDAVQMPGPQEAYAVVGRTQPKLMEPNPNLGGYEAFVMRVAVLAGPPPTPQVQWSGIYYGLKDDEAYSVMLDAQSNIVLAGWSASYPLTGHPADTNLFIAKVGLSGNRLWDKIYGWPDHEEKVMDDQSLILDSDGGYVVSGWTHSQGPGMPQPNFLVLKTDPAGTALWCRVHPSVSGLLEERAYPMGKTIAGGYAIAGYNQSFPPGLDDFHLLTLDGQGNRPYCALSVDPLWGSMEYMMVPAVYTDEWVLRRDFYIEPYEVEYRRVCRRDVGCFLIKNLPANVDSMTSYALSCSLYNCGSATETYWVRMKIYDALNNVVYNQTAQASNHAAGTPYILSTFPAFANWPRGSITVRCSTELNNDEDNSNDAASAGITGHVRDVAVVEVFDPVGTYNSGVSVAPVCSVYNYGTDAETYTVGMKIGAGTGYSGNATTHAAGTGLRVPLAPNWTANPVGTHAVRCSTELATDVVTTNNMKLPLPQVTVRTTGGHDVACIRLYAPSGTADSGGTAVVPACSLYNYGASSESYQVTMHIGDTVITDNITSHPASSGLRHNFSRSWIPQPVGILAVRCTTDLSTDDTPGNDFLDGTVSVQRRGADVGCAAIIAPSGVVAPSTIVAPACSVYNYGNTTPASYDVRMQIGTGYDEARSVTSHAPGTWRVISSFPSWNSGSGGFYQVRSFTLLTGDVQRHNDTASSSCIVRTTWPAGWAEVESMPSGLSSKPPKDGAWLAYNPDNGLVYGAKGNKTNEFYSYDQAADVWAVLETIPSDESGRSKPPKNGCVGVAGGGSIYMTKGNNTQGFWRYDIAGNSWHKLADVPLGTDGKRVKGGNDMAYVPATTDGDSDYVYLLKGYKTSFYRYSVPGNFWDTTLVDAPAGPKGKWGKGSWVMFNPQPEPPGEPWIAAHMAKYNDGTNHYMYVFDVSRGTWSANVTGMPLLGQHGARARNKKSKDGGAAALGSDGTGYALKGGNTQQFFSFIIDDNSDAPAATWTELDTIPFVGSTGRKKGVKNGGDIVSTGMPGGFDVFHVLKGNKAYEMWRYVHTGPREHSCLAPHSGAMAGRTASGEPRMAIAPNPLASGFVTLSYSLPKAGPVAVTLFDVAGRCVLARRLVTANCDLAIPLDLRVLSSGVYLVRFDADGYSATQKLVVQH